MRKIKKFALSPAAKRTLKRWFQRVDPSKKLRGLQGIRIEGEKLSAPGNTQSYDGTTLTLLSSDPYNIIHEICHHLVSKHRDIANWGLGVSPFEEGECPPSLKVNSQKLCDQEEIDVCFLHVAVAKLLGAKGHDLYMEADTVRVNIPKPAAILKLQEKYPCALPPRVWAKLASTRRPKPRG